MTVCNDPCQQCGGQLEKMATLNNGDLWLECQKCGTWWLRPAPLKGAEDGK